MRVLWSHFSSCVITFNNDSLAITAASRLASHDFTWFYHEALRVADKVYFHDFNVELLQISARKHIAIRTLINDNNSRTGWAPNEFTVAIKWKYNYNFSILFLRHGMTDEILVKLSFEVTIKFLFFLLLLYNIISFVHWYYEFFMVCYLFPLLFVC